MGGVWARRTAIKYEIAQRMRTIRVLGGACACRPLHLSGMTMTSTTPDHDAVIASTVDWMEKAVIGLNLCPFAKAVHVKKQIRYVVCEAATPEELLEKLIEELEYLAETSPEKVDTTMIIHPNVLADFEDYNEFLDVADAALEDLELDGILQVASFHPDYQFADTHKNRSEERRVGKEC